MLIPSLLLLACVAIALFAYLPARQTALRQRVVVNLVDGKAVDGVLWSRRRGLVVLKDATLLERGAEPMRVDGEVLVERHRIDFIQRTGG